MLIFYGVKSKAKEVGRVADYCPVCYRVRGFRLFRESTAATVYGVTLVDGDATGFHATCETCGNKIKTHERKYAGVSGDVSLDIDTLLKHCGPTLTESLARKVDFGDRILAATLTSEERKTALNDLVEMLNDQAKARRYKTKFDVKGERGCSATFSFMVVMGMVATGLFYILPQYKRELTQYSLYIFPLGFLIGCIYTIFVIATDTRRFVHSEIIPRLARGLAPFKLSADDVENLVARYRKRNFTLTQNLEPEELYAAIESVTAAQTRPQSATA